MKNYANDYRKGKEGYEYTGNWYETSFSEEELKKELNICAAILLGMSVLLAAGLFLDNVGNRNFFVLLPYVGMLAPVGCGWMSCAALRRAAQNWKKQGGRMRRSEYEQAFCRPRRCGIGAGMLSGTALVANALAVSKAPGGILEYPQEVLFCCILVSLCALSFWYAKRAERLKRSV